MYEVNDIFCSGDCLQSLIVFFISLFNLKIATCLEFYIFPYSEANSILSVSKIILEQPYYLKRKQNSYYISKNVLIYFNIAKT